MSFLTENKTIKVKPDKIRLTNLLDDIKDGLIQVPVFQRDFIWNPTQIRELLDSISKGYPVGSMLFWKPNQRFKTKPFIGPYRVGSEFRNGSYVLDGYQRISTLYGTLMNPDKFLEEDKQASKSFLIYYDLREKEFTYTRTKKDGVVYLMPVYKIIDTFEYLDFIRDIELNIVDKNEVAKLINNAKEISKIFYDYEIPFVEINRGDIRDAVEIFSRINSTGTDISPDFMLSALSYNEKTDFLFSDRITEFVNSLSKYNFASIKRDTILNCISSSNGKIYFDVKIEDLLKYNLEDLTSITFKHILKAIQFLYEELLIVDVKFLPYPTQLIFITEYFRLNPNPTPDGIKDLKNWFWTTTYSNYFSIYSLSQQRAAYKIFVSFAQGSHWDGVLRLNDKDKFETAKFPDKINFTGVRTKALQLFLINRSYANSKPEECENIREIFIFNKKDRTPGNLILRMDSDAPFKDINSFFFDSSQDVLKNAFITPELITLYTLDQEEEFITKREELIKAAERIFVEQLDISYESTMTFNS